MSKIVRNVTASPITVNDVGVTIPGTTDYTIPPQDYLLWAASSNAVTYVGASTLVINDGSVDLSISDGIFLLKGLFPTPFLITTPFNATLSMATAGTEYSYAFPATVKQYQVKSRGSSKLRYAFIVGETSTNYTEVKAGAALLETGIRRATTLTLYLRATQNSEIAEITYWT